MARTGRRKANELRRIKLTKDCNKYAEGSCLVEFGETKVICTASVEDGVPAFLKNSGTGWVTAEYGMLPRACDTRVRRSLTSGRSQEIQRLIGRSLRAVVDRERLGERTIKIDCDVIQADGGTRTASITGAYVALVLALRKIKQEGLIGTLPLTDYVAAVSVGIVKKKMLLDLDYREDSGADMDMNVVMVGKGEFVEVQGTAEGKTFSKPEIDKLLSLAQKGIRDLISLQKKCLGKK